MTVLRFIKYTQLKCYVVFARSRIEHVNKTNYSKGSNSQMCWQMGDMSVFSDASGKACLLSLWNTGSMTLNH